jgi:hypothetical protein
VLTGPNTVTINKSNANTAYWLTVSANANGSADITAVTRPGTWNADKQGLYTSNNTRTLNWVSNGIPSSSSIVLVPSDCQGQNTNIFQQTGLDTTEPVDNGIITISVGSLVEVNGSLFKFHSTITINKAGGVDTANWVAIKDNGNGTASITAVTRPGVWSPEKHGFYRPDGSRTLNWVSNGTLSSVPSTAVYTKTTKGAGEYILKNGWYYIELASGAGRGNGGFGGSGGYTGGQGRNKDGNNRVSIYGTVEHSSSVGSGSAGGGGGIMSGGGGSLSTS